MAYSLPANNFAPASRDPIAKSSICCVPFKISWNGQVEKYSKTDKITAQKALEIFDKMAFWATVKSVLTCPPIIGIEGMFMMTVRMAAAVFGILAMGSPLGFAITIAIGTYGLFSLLHVCSLYEISRKFDDISWEASKQKKKLQKEIDSKVVNLEDLVSIRASEWSPD